MKHPERVEDYLEHIAVIRNIEIIGEAARQIQQQAPEYVAAHPELPWVEMQGMRNKLIHNYFDIDIDTVRGTVKTGFPRLKQQIKALLQDPDDNAKAPPQSS